MLRLSVAFLSLLILCTCAKAPSWSIALHGGAGVIKRADMDAKTEAEYRATLSQALEAGSRILAQGGSSLDAVEASIKIMEDSPLFNAGKGAVFTAQGRNELDASIMDGRTRAAGAVAGVTQIAHPISLARAVMEKSPHVMLIDDGAEAFAREQHFELVDRSYFFTERRWQQMLRRVKRMEMPAPSRPRGAPPEPANAANDNDNAELENAHRFGTVGVVARDAHGDLAAGTSTGGINAKLWGRVGDSPLIGAGTYAQNGVCAVSATGAGEYFIRVGVARDICARMQFEHASAVSAARTVIQDEVAPMGGDGGVIVMDGQGRVAFAMNTSGMYRARQSAGAAPVFAIFAGEKD